MAAGAAQKGIALGCEVGDAVPERIVTDPMRLRQILTNLLSNAAKFTEAGAITVRVDYDAGRRRAAVLRVEVRDTGIGIAADQVDQVFEQFVQIDNSLTRRTGGTGLGLAITKQLVELMGGDIGVTSTPGAGSVFTFTDPRPAAARRPRGARRARRRRRGGRGRPARRCGCCWPRTTPPTSI